MAMEEPEVQVAEVAVEVPMAEAEQMVKMEWMVHGVIQDIPEKLNTSNWNQFHGNKKSEGIT